MINGVIIKKLTKNADERGWLTEVFRRDELDFDPVMSYISLTNPGVIRGPHEHETQSDCFIFLGPGTFRLHLWDRRETSTTKGEAIQIELGEDSPTMVVVPPGVVHGYKCISSIPALSINMPDRLYRGIGKQDEIDEIRWEKVPDSPYVIV